VPFRVENILDKSKAQLQAITKLACGSNSCNRLSGVYPELAPGLRQALLDKTLSMDVIWATGR
jgi:hypothetical protein